MDVTLLGNVFHSKDNRDTNNTCNNDKSRLSEMDSLE